MLRSLSQDLRGERMQHCGKESNWLWLRWFKIENPSEVIDDLNFSFKALDWLDLTWVDIHVFTVRVLQLLIYALRHCPLVPPAVLIRMPRTKVLLNFSCVLFRICAQKRWLKLHGTLYWSSSTDEGLCLWCCRQCGQLSLASQLFQFYNTLAS